MPDRSLIPPKEQLRPGLRQTLRAVQRGEARRVYVARDAGLSPDGRSPVTAPAEEAARAAGIEIVHVPTMKMLGQRCGIAVGCACAAEIAAPEKSVRS